MSERDEKAELLARLEKAKAVRAEYEPGAARAELEALRREVELEEREARDAPAIAKAEEEHGPIGEKIAVVKTGWGSVVLKRPNHVIFKRFQDKASAKSDDFLALVKPCVVYPDAKTVEVIVEEYPATLVDLADVVVELARGRAREVSAK